MLTRSGGCWHDVGVSSLVSLEKSLSLWSQSWFNLSLLFRLETRKVSAFGFSAPWRIIHNRVKKSISHSMVRQDRKEQEKADEIQELLLVIRFVDRFTQELKIASL